jgi:hypothetical protein
MQNSVDVKAAMISYLKSQTSVTSLLSTSKEIREAQWQGEDFVFPAIRVSVDFIPSINGCGPDEADFVIEVFSDEPSSLTADKISGAILALLHKRPFTMNTIKFPVVIVTRVDKAERSIYGWLSRVHLKTEPV